jgi:hypothetical protein
MYQNEADEASSEHKHFWLNWTEVISQYVDERRISITVMNIDLYVCRPSTTLLGVEIMPHFLLTLQALILTSQPVGDLSMSNHTFICCSQALFSHLNRASHRDIVSIISQIRYKIWSISNFVKRLESRMTLNL